ncbi:hypothetical protein KIW84_015343 [Lathyrus oleraceus]|uniref:magnesium chelatase n=1 Tax=Pisum sativum TaxID=3888 RepID=A0A9D5H0L6_PEA|nr:hypothetical protein KIW84_015343 [Pisum sativum]
MWFLSFKVVIFILFVTEFCGGIGINGTKGKSQFPVNLLKLLSRTVGVLLDSAASGWNTVEREGISISHPARFILIGSGNPEEGGLGPRLLDRFGMHAQVGTVREAELRVKIVEESARFDKNPKEFRETYKAEAAKALAALKGRDKVSVEDIATVIPNCLRHRLRKDPLESIDSGLLVTEKFYEIFS